MDILSAPSDFIAPRAARGERFPKWLALRATAERLSPSGGMFGFAGLVGLCAFLFVYLFMEEMLLALQLWVLQLWALSSLPGGTSVTLSLTLVAGAVAGRHVVRPMTRRRRAPAPADLQRVLAILHQQPNASAGLVRLGDKQVMFSSAGDAFIMYGVKGRSQIALFDPVGPKEAWHELVVAFVRHARQNGLRPVFYQVSPQFLPLAVEAGLSPLKLGEQAIVDLQSFSLAGGDWLKLRRSINRAERDGLEFSYIEPADLPAILQDLKAVSDSWLSGHQAAEKGFSLGTFCEAYLAQQSLAVIRDHGRIVAFASIMTTADQQDAFIDLMRHIPGTHRGMMDLLFARLMESLKAKGFETLNMGMAPLAGLPTHAAAPVWNHIGRHVFEHGERYYNFKGLQAFKAKFDPRWEPRYLAVAGAGLPLGSLLDVTMLIGGGLGGLFRRARA